MLIHELEEKGLLGTGDCNMLPPSWLANNTCYLTISGSHSYGIADTNADEASDFDTIGICIPPQNVIFPHLNGWMFCFDELPKELKLYQEHRCFDKDALKGKGRNYDLNIFNIVKFVCECAYGNPGMIDSLFTSRECVLHCSQAGSILRDNRKLFLAKNLWQTYKNYGYKQSHKMRSKKPKGKRLAQREKYGFDVKFGYNIVRLINEAEQIFLEGDLDLMRSREQLKAIRRGEWTQDQVMSYLTEKEKQLEELHLKSDLPSKPDMGKVKEILFQCLECQYGSLDNYIKVPDRAENLLKEISQLVRSAGY